MKNSKNRPSKSRQIFEIMPREKDDPLINDPFSSPNIIVPVQNIEKDFLKRLGITEDMLPVNMRSRPQLQVVNDNSITDPEAFTVLYEDDEEYDELTDQYIQQANQEQKSVSFGDYGYIMNRFLSDLGTDHVNGEEMPLKKKPIDFSNSLGTSCATSRRSRALQEFDERFQLFLDYEARNNPSFSNEGREGFEDIDMMELSADLDILMNMTPKEDLESAQADVEMFDGSAGGCDNYSGEQVSDSDQSTVMNESEEDFPESEAGSRRSSLRCMFSGSLIDGSECDNRSILSISSRISQPREIVHRRKPKTEGCDGKRMRRESQSEIQAEELPVLPQPDFSQIDRKAWKALVKEDRKLKRIRKKETKVLFTANKLQSHRFALRGTSNHVNIT